MNALTELLPVALFLGWSGIWFEALRRVSRSEAAKRHNDERN
jgi:hypothetical protein